MLIRTAFHHWTLPVYAVIVGFDQLVDFRHDFHPAYEVDVIVNALPVLAVGEVVVEPLRRNRRHPLTHQDLTHRFVEDHLRLRTLRFVARA